MSFLGWRWTKAMTRIDDSSSIDLIFAIFILGWFLCPLFSSPDFGSSAFCRSTCGFFDFANKRRRSNIQACVRNEILSRAKGKQNKDFARRPDFCSAPCKHRILCVPVRGKRPVCLVFPATSFLRTSHFSSPAIFCLPRRGNVGV